MATSVYLQVCNQLLLLRKHRLECVKLSLQLLNGNLRFSLGSRRILGVHPGAKLSNISVQLVPALDQGGHPRHPLLADLVAFHPALFVSLHLLIRILVSCHFLSGCSGLFQDLQLCFAFFLEVPRVTQDFTGLYQGLGLGQAVNDSLLCLFHPGIKSLYSGLELSKVLDVFTELGTFRLDLGIKFVQLIPHCLQAFNKLLSIAGNLLATFREDISFLSLLFAAEL